MEGVMIRARSQLVGILCGTVCLSLIGGISAAQDIIKEKTLVPVYSLLLFDFKAGPNVQLVRDIYPGAADSYPEGLFAWNGLLFFGADDGTYGNEVWTSDGTGAGTAMLKDIHFGPGRSNGYQFYGWNRDFTAMGGNVYFAATDGDHPVSLWKTDGTGAGTSEVYSVSPSDMTVLNGALIFNGYTGDVELWKSDGTSEGTAVLKNISQNADSYPGSMTGFVLFNNELYFDVANTASNTPPEPCELWKTDGTEAGTVAVKPGTALEPGEELGVCGGYLYFPVDDAGVYGLWRSDGTAGGTVQLPGLSFTGSSPRRFTVYNGDLYFSANDGTHGWEVWKLNCTAGTAAMVKDISPDPNSDSPSELTVYNGLLYFRATHPDYGDELWRTDGTEPGTTLVEDINPGSNGSSLYDLTEFNGLLYFSADDGEHGDELWQSDGTGAGTTLVKDIYPGLEGSDPYELTPVGNALFFGASDGAAGWELWKLQQ
jgi:ELWxxDGT repeat protein